MFMVCCVLLHSVHVLCDLMIHEHVLRIYMYGVKVYDVTAFAVVGE